MVGGADWTVRPEHEDVRVRPRPAVRAEGRLERDAPHEGGVAALLELGEAVALAGYKQTPGNRGVWMLRRDVEERSEFVMFTLWDSLDAVVAFATEDYEAASSNSRTRGT